jgi:hypothetical protein
MRSSRLRLYAAGLLAFLIGVPLTEQAYGQVGDIIWSSVNLAGAIADASGGS